jgi:hypothetical protein
LHTIKKNPPHAFDQFHAHSSVATGISIAHLIGSAGEFDRRIRMQNGLQLYCLWCLMYMKHGAAGIRRPRKHLRTGSSGSHRTGRLIGTPPIELTGRTDAPLLRAEALTRGRVSWSIGLR